MHKKRNILLTPGPANTSEQVKQAQIVQDICPREVIFCKLMESIAKDITLLSAEDSSNISTTLFGASGTAAVEALISSVIGDNDKLLIIDNGAYGARAESIASIYKLNTTVYKSSSYEPINLVELEKVCKKNTITHLYVVHHETTTGLLNNLKELGNLCIRNNIEMLVDAISSFAALPIDMNKLNISHMAASSNKNIQGMAGLSFIISKNDSLEKIKKIAPRNLYLNLYDQYSSFQKSGQMRFTPPVQVTYALEKAIQELKKETIHKRYERYKECWGIINNGLKKVGLKTLVASEHSSKLITTILEPFSSKEIFEDLHDYLVDKGITIYPGKVLNTNCFRISNIGNIQAEDAYYFNECLTSFFNEMNLKIQ